MKARSQHSSHLEVKNSDEEVEHLEVFKVKNSINVFQGTDSFLVFVVFISNW